MNAEVRNQKSEDRRQELGRVYVPFTPLRLCGFALMTLWFCLCTPAQDYSIDWWTVDGGGGTTSDGVYEVSGTIGQPDAGTISVNGYAIEGGYWDDIEAVQTPGAPRLTIERTPVNSVIVSWPATWDEWQLQESLAPAFAPWNNVTVTPQLVAGRFQVEVDPPLGKRFYRLQKSTAPMEPTLTIKPSGTNTLLISWPYPSTGYVLQENSALGTPNWVNVTNAPMHVDDTWLVVVPTSGEARYYRLHKLEAPALRIELTDTNSVIVAWPYPSDGFSLQQNTDVGTTNWAAVTNIALHVGGEWQAIVSPPVGNRFYRLLKP